MNAEARTANAAHLSVGGAGGGPTPEMVGRRLAEEMRAVLIALGWPERSARGIAKLLGIDMNICHRAASAAKAAADPVEALRKTPGIEGIGQLRLAAGRAGVNPMLLDALDAATVMLTSLLDQHGGSLNRLREALDNPADPNNPDAWTKKDQLASRRAAFGAIAACTGSQVDTHALSVFLREAGKTGAEHLEGLSLHAYVGWRSRSGGMPMLLSTIARSRTDTSSDDVAASSPDTSLNESTIVERYCSKPLPMLTAHAAASEQSLLVLDPSQQSQQDHTLVLASPVRNIVNPRLGLTRQHTSFVRCRYPTKELVMDVYLSRELASTCVPSAGVYWSAKWLTDGQAAPWHDRVPGPTSVLVSPGSAVDNPSKSCPWYAQMVSEAASQYGWNLGAMVRHRLHVAYPLWGAAHLIMFDFDAPMESEK